MSPKKKTKSKVNQSGPDSLKSKKRQAHISTDKQKQGEATLGASVELMRLWKELDDAS